MIDKAALCEKIRELYPDIGECGIDIKVEYDEVQKAWVVHLKKDNQELKTYLEDDDAEKCMLGEKCVGLGIEVAQLRANIERIEIIADGKAYRQFLKPGEKPEASFPVTADNIQTREYCNIHGLWKG